MESNEETYRLFKDFLEGNLSENDTIQFTDRLTTDADFKESFNAFEIERSLIIQHELLQSKAILAQYDYGKPKKKFNFWLMGLLASIAILFIVFILNSITHEDTKHKGGITEQKSPHFSKKSSTSPQLDSSTKPRKKENIQDHHVVQYSTSSVPKVDTSHTDKGDTTSYKLGLIDKNEVSQTVDTIKMPSTPIVDNGHQEIEQSKNTQQTTSLRDCDDVKWSPLFTISPSCQEDDNGHFEVSTQQPNLTLYFNNEIRTDDFYFDELTKGEYLLRMLTPEGCEYTKTIHIKEKACFDLDVVIDHQLDVNWKIPLTALLIIRNKSGQVVYQSQVRKGDLYKGIDQYGTPLKSGLYFFELKHDFISQGTITIP